MNPRTLSFLGAALFVALFLGFIADGSRSGSDPGAPSFSEVPFELPEKFLPVLPDSLAGTQEDGALLVDEMGRFVPSPDAIDLFDYYLTAIGEESAEVVHARILAAIRRQLVSPAQDAAIDLLDDYLRYRERASGLLSAGLIGEDLDRRLQYIRELRREVFGSDIAGALFGEEEDRWFTVLEQRRIVLDPILSEEERSRRLSAIEAEQPPDEVAARERAEAHASLRSDEAALREQGAQQVEIRQMRVDRFGEAAADRLQALDTARADWERRVGAYGIERDAMFSATSPAERTEAIVELRRQYFGDNEGELLRVRAMDRVVGTPGL